MSSTKTFNLTTGDFFNAMWKWTIEKYPHLAVIDDSNYIHAILSCDSEEKQNYYLNLFLDSKKLNK